VPIANYEEAMGKSAKKKIMHCGQSKHILTFGVRGGALINVVSDTLSCGRGSVRHPPADTEGIYGRGWITALITFICEVGFVMRLTP
jgi:hypothetical protein